MECGEEMRESDERGDLSVGSSYFGRLAWLTNQTAPVSREKMIPTSGEAARGRFVWRGISLLGALLHEFKLGHRSGSRPARRVHY